MKKVYLALVVVFFLIVSTTSFAKILSVAKKSVPIYFKPLIKSKIKWKAVLYTPLEVVGSEGDWYQIRDFERTTGWVKKNNLSTVPTIIIKEKEANIRSGPGVHYEIKWQSYKGIPLRCLRTEVKIDNNGKKKKWLKVVDIDDDIGWVFEPLTWGRCE